MRVRTLLIGGVLLALSLVAGRLAVLAQSEAEYARLDALQGHVDHVARDTTALLLLSQDFLLGAGERASRQWAATDKSLRSRLASMTPLAQGVQPELAELQRHADALPELFAAMQANAALTDEAHADRGRALVADHLTLRTRAMSEAVFALSERTVTLRQQRAGRDSIVTLATMLGFTLVVLTLSVLVTRRVLRPIAALETAARAIGEGRLDARSGYRAADEFGRLSQAFDSMADSLGAALRDREALLNTIHLHAIVSVADGRGRIVEVNDNFCRVSGYAREELLGQDHRMINSVTHPPGFWAGMWHTTSTGQPWRAEVCNRRKDGSLYWVDSIIAPFRDAHGRIDRYISIRFDITEAKLTQHDLAASRNFLARTGRLAGVGGWELDLRTERLVWSDETRRLHEVAADFEPSLHNTIDFYAPEARPHITAAVQAGIEHGRGWDLELPMVTATGRTIWARAVGDVEHEAGVPVRLVGAFQDVTQRRLLEQTIAENERFLRRITDGVPMRIAYIDRARRYRFVNEAECRGLGRRREDVLGRTHAELGVPASLGLDAAVEAAMAGQVQRLEHEETAADGTRRCIEWHFVPHRRDGADPEDTGVFVIGNDITEHQRAEAALRETSALLENVLDSATEVAMIATGLDGTVRLFNRGAERMLGLRRDAVVGRMSSLDFHDRDELTRHARALEAKLGENVRSGLVLTHPSQLGQRSEWTYRRGDGTRLPVALVVTPMHDTDGQCFGYLGIAYDMTEQNTQAQALHAAMLAAHQASEAKSQFLANMSHEVRTPMNAVMGLTRLLAATPLNTEQAAFVDKMQRAHRSLLAVINDILDLSKVEAGELRLEAVAFDPAELLRDQAALAQVDADARGIGFALELAHDLPQRLVGDPTRLGQVLANLLGNAVKFTPAGQVRLAASVEPPAGGSNGARVTLVVKVHDTGIGIPADVQDKLFSPFIQADGSTTRRFGGTGLGLSIVKRLVELMGGSVRLDSAPGVGSLFTVAVPLALPSAAGEALADEAVDLGPTPLAGLRLLLVDDSPINQEVASRLLAAEGAEVAVASDGQQALARLRDAAQPFHAVLMDLQMPVMDGQEATRRIRADRAFDGLKVIALTAAAVSVDRARAEAAGFDAYVSKPFEPRDLVRTLLASLGRGATAGAAAPPPARAPSIAWQPIDGVDAATAQERLGPDQRLLLTLLDRLLEDAAHALEDGLPLPERAARLHRLRGGAGMLGAVGLQQVAAAAEQASLNGDDPVPLDGVRAEVVALRDSLAQVPAAPPVQEATSIDSPALLSELVQALRLQDMAALALFEQASGLLAGRLQPDALAHLRSLMAGLQFAEVADRVEQVQRAASFT